MKDPDAQLLRAYKDEKSALSFPSILGKLKGQAIADKQPSLNTPTINLISPKQISISQDLPSN